MTQDLTIESTDDERLTKKEKEILSEVTKIQHYDCCYLDGEDSDPKEFEDDCFIHISRGRLRFIFYNGQGDNYDTEEDEDKNRPLDESDVKKYAKLVDQIYKNKQKVRKFIITNIIKYEVIAEDKDRAISKCQNNEGKYFNSFWKAK